eukprot:GILI01007954.1.p1 GENE.GILI01007954.1~~GILI01007954.1.p1  ORF type:complete len:423 (-),score=12.16 GILI01007954.1:116-1330(-)
MFVGLRSVNRCAIVIFLVCIISVFAIFQFKTSEQTFSESSHSVSCLECPPVFTDSRNSSLLYDDFGHSHLAASSLPATDVAFLTQEVQAAIYRHQHPVNCKSAKFYVMNDFRSGFGSIIHVSGAALALALNQGRIFLFGAKTGTVYTDPKVCKKDNIECHVRPPSSCTLADLTSDNHIEHSGLDDTLRLAFPDMFKDALLAANPSMTSMEMLYWWRAQSAAYLLRLNSEAISHIRQLRLDPSLHSFAGPFQFPLQPGTTSAHVRHGDKYLEMKLVPFQEYMVAADYLQHNFPMSLKRSMFLSTEDEGVLTEGRSNTFSWAVHYSTIPRKNVGPQEQMQSMSTGAGLLTRYHILQLLMALECDAFIGTRESNWNRLIDELRCVWVPKCRMPFVEVGDKSVDSYSW